MLWDRSSRPRRYPTRTPTKDDHSRVAYVEALNDQTADTLVGFFEQARLWFQSIGVEIKEVSEGVVDSSIWR